MNLKVLTLENWMLFSFEEPEEYIHSNTIKEIKPIINRDGYYMLDGFVWFEHNNKAYEIINGKSGFNYTIKHKCPQLLRDCEVKLVKDLIKNRLPIDSKLKERYNIHCQYMEVLRLLRDIDLFASKLMLIA
jgi:hypothetical protein